MVWFNAPGTCSVYASLQLSSNLSSSEYIVTVGEIQEFVFDYSVARRCMKSQTQCRITVMFSDDYIIDLVSPKDHLVPPGSQTGELKVRLEGLLPGRVTLQIQYSEDGPKGDRNEKMFVYPLQVQRIETLADILFTASLVLITAATTVGIGCEVDLDVVMKQLKAPTSLAIGICSQYVFMPLIAFTVVEMSDLLPGIKLGLFALGCSPGGTASNAYSYLLGGDASLSITMTVVSTVLALAMMPLWLFTIGADIIQNENIRIPFHVIIGTLVAIIGPCAVGLYIRRKNPRLAAFLISSIKYLTLFFLTYCFTVGVYINLFAFQLMRPRVLLASGLVPFTGFLLGGLAAFMMGRDKISIITIALETGIQNNGVPIVMMRLSMTGPERDTSVVGPVASGIVSTLPLGIAVLVILIRNKIAFQQATEITKRVEIQTDGSDGFGQVANLEEVKSLGTEHSKDDISVP
ncbi:ileal sodium/bile acid cotransporter [Elysia marginata]|uniref:Ileal sodium/bile acid cotransporter n=1 Tax=Elysia marginata TaxID=1093978 RepID=A0AAV4HM33_9GAST|nr:ileal sodium/bile acid cotransporter [Elysia marginata]